MACLHFNELQPLKKTALLIMNDLWRKRLESFYSWGGGKGEGGLDVVIPKNQEEKGNSNVWKREVRMNRQRN